jgi:hypothetical protein
MQQLQECVTKLKIISFERRGKSVSEYMDEFVKYRLANLHMYPYKNDPEALTVVFDTLALLHIRGPDGLLEEIMTQLPVAPANEEHYWITGFFLPSEREVVGTSYMFFEIYAVTSHSLVSLVALPRVPNGSVQSHPS